MDHSERLQQTCYELLQQLNDDLNNSRPQVVDCTEVLHRCQTLIHNEANPQIKEVLATLSEVIGAYFQGRIAESALLYYLSEQFKITDKDIRVLAKGLVELRTLPENGLPTASPLIAYPKISVIITTYNRKAFLHKAIESILLQDYPHKEITVIDDCSTDGTDVLMKISYGDEPRVNYMRNETNSGPGNNRRKAFAAHADGEYILFLDDDDYLIDMNYLSKAVEFHQHHPEISFVAANVFLEYSQSKQLKVSSLQLSEIIRKHDYFMNFEQKGYPKPASTLTTIFKREALIQMDILNMNMVNDASIYLRSLLIGDAGFIDVIAGVYRIHGNNITFNLSQGFLIENLEEKILIKNMAIEQYGYGKQEMNEWFNHNVYDTISYYLMNSAKTHTDFQYMYTWAHHHCPNIYYQLRSEFRVRFMKKQLLRVSFVRSLLNRS
ncbi:glycosyltransferase family 2 protein [Paenibacillus monticola]|uniref:Glycosyltransferase n=1 Tax=Paenibacillus monticola TaxID=2666075 RepID=A0A7X2L4R4_9BACL|nr:glycosyltransferase family 2 protein [Paenibacillus monticola]MRN56620.1 glycosyltransferase [Paenibacillus monticola]